MEKQNAELEISKIITGPIDANTYICSIKGQSDAFVVDPADAKKVLDFLSMSGKKCTHILITHGHFDHIMGVAELKHETNAIVCIHKKDESCLESNRTNLAVFCGEAVIPCTADLVLQDESKLTAAGINIDVLWTPGHSKGSVCYILKEFGVLFSGDTLFRLSVGRTDLYRSDEKELKDSIINKLYKLDRDYRVLPGHMRETTLQFEKEHNPETRHLRFD